MDEQMPNGEIADRSERTEVLRKQAMRKVLLFHEFRQMYPDADFGGEEEMTPEQSAVWNKMSAD